MLSVALCLGSAPWSRWRWSLSTVTSSSRGLSHPLECCLGSGPSSSSWRPGPTRWAGACRRSSAGVRTRDTAHLEYCIRQHVTVTAFIRLNNTLMSGRLPTKIQIKTAVQRTTSLCVNVSGAYVPEGLMTSCTWDYMTFTPSVRAYTMLLFIFVFFLPLFIIIYCYIFIFRAIRTTNQSVWISDVFRSAVPDFSDWLKLVCVSGQWGRLTAVFTVTAALVIPWSVSIGCRTSGRWRRSRSSSSCSTSSPGRRTPPWPSPPSPGKTLEPPHLWKRVCHLSRTTTKLWALCRWTSSDGH